MRGIAWKSGMYKNWEISTSGLRFLQLFFLVCSDVPQAMVYTRKRNMYCACEYDIAWFLGLFFPKGILLVQFPTFVTIRRSVEKSFPNAKVENELPEADNKEN